MKNFRGSPLLRFRPFVSGLEQEISEGLFLLLCFPACVVAREMFTAWEVALEMFTGNRTALDSISILEQPENGIMPQVINRQSITQIIEFQVTHFFL